MLYQTGTVTEVSGRGARVEFQPVTVCGGCSGGQGCGLGPLLAMFRRNEQNSLRFQIERGDCIRVGDRVRVALPPGQLVKFASLAYLMPLIGLAVGAWLATTIVPNGGDLSSVTGAMIGMLAGWRGLVAGGNRAQVKLLALNAEYELVVYSRRGCHLCELLLEELAPLARDRARISVRDVDDRPEWQSVYGDRVPVICCDGQEICHYHLDRSAVWAKIAPSEF